MGNFNVEHSTPESHAQSSRGDNAGRGNDCRGQPFSGSYDAQEHMVEFELEIGVRGFYGPGLSSL
jgi:hypothetical protein